MVACNNENYTAQYEGFQVVFERTFPYVSCLQVDSPENNYTLYLNQTVFKGDAGNMMNYGYQSLHDDRRASGQQFSAFDQINYEVGLFPVNWGAIYGWQASEKSAT